jgi:hypothetical protein
LLQAANIAAAAKHSNVALRIDVPLKFLDSFNARRRNIF